MRGKISANIHRECLRTLRQGSAWLLAQNPLHKLDRPCALSPEAQSKEDRVNCPFYFKIGACRNGDRCNRARILVPCNSRSRSVIQASADRVYKPGSQQAGQRQHAPDSPSVQASAEAQADGDEEHICRCIVLWQAWGVLSSRCAGSLARNPHPAIQQYPRPFFLLLHIQVRSNILTIPNGSWTTLTGQDHKM